MGNQKNPEKPVEAKVYFTEAELEAMEQFRKGTEIPSRNKLFHNAITYYMHMVRESGGAVVGPHSFPVRAEGRPNQVEETPVIDHTMVRRPRSA